MWKTACLLTALALTTALSAVPYYSMRHEGLMQYVFHGDVQEQNMGLAQKLEEEYMEYERRRPFYASQLKELGVEVEAIRNDDMDKSNLPFHIQNPELPAGVKAW